jgi:hypoxanthine-guanine phosphoribosyltransferase
VTIPNHKKYKHHKLAGIRNLQDTTLMQDILDAGKPLTRIICFTAYKTGDDMKLRVLMNNDSHSSSPGGIQSGHLLREIPS